MRSPYVTNSSLEAKQVKEMDYSQENETIEIEPKESPQSPKKKRLMKNYDSQKQEKIRLANRRAARKCRNRKKLFNNILDSRMKELEGENEALCVQHQALSLCLKQVLIAQQQQQRNIL